MASPCISARFELLRTVKVQKEAFVTACDFNAPRLFLDHPLRMGETIPLDRAQTNYLLNVLRLKDKERILVFNGRDGEWLAEICPIGRKGASLSCLEQTRLQPEAPDLVYCFAPLKHARLKAIQGV